MRLSVAGSSVYAYTGTRAFDGLRPTVLFVHGAATDHGVFALQSRYFAWHGMNVLAVDLPAHGRSEGEALPSVEALADWLRGGAMRSRAPITTSAGHFTAAAAAIPFA
jgi:pimeloyl-ACP methyl ester carboxylesterase